MKKLWEFIKGLFGKKKPTAFGDPPPNPPPDNPPHKPGT